MKIEKEDFALKVFQEVAVSRSRKDSSKESIDDFLGTEAVSDKLRRCGGFD